MADLLSVKAGDRVWIGRGQYPRSEGIKNVVRLTPTQIVVDWNGGGGSYQPRFRKEGGNQIGAGNFPDYVSAIATPEECEQWDQEQAEKHKREEVAWNLKEEREAKATEMSELFNGLNVNVGDCHNTKGQEQGLWDIHFYDLSEESVRLIAKALAGAKQ